MSKVVVMDHPLIQHKIGIIRRTETSSKEFREMIGEIAMLMCYEATRDLKLEEVEIETPITKMTAKELAGKKLAVVPILRAGLGMVEGMLAMIPAAKVGHIGLYRDPETLVPVEYYCKLPADSSERDIFVDAGNRWIRRSSNYHAETERCKKYPLHVYHCSTGRCKETAGSTPGCGYLYRCTG